MIRVGIWEGLQEGSTKSYLNLIVFQYHVAMIFWTHIKCMTTDPGVIPRDYEDLNFNKVSPQMKGTILAVKAEIKKQEDAAAAEKIVARDPKDIEAELQE